jgi:hypothetical protein
MRYFLAILLLSVAVQGQSFTANAPELPDSPSQMPFWTIENKVNTGILAALATADAITTQRGMNQGMREVNPLMRPFVRRGAAGQAAGTVLGFGVAMGSVYFLHHTHHYKMERVVMRLMVAGEGGFVANNIVALH